MKTTRSVGVTGAAPRQTITEASLSVSRLIRPTLTVAKQPTYEFGQTAAHLLIQRIDQPARPPSKIVLTTMLNVAKSSVRGSSVATLAAVMAKGNPEAWAADSCPC